MAARVREGQIWQADGAAGVRWLVLSVGDGFAWVRWLGSIPTATQDWRFVFPLRVFWAMVLESDAVDVLYVD